MLYNKHNLAVAKIAEKNSQRQELAGVMFTKDKTVATDAIRLLEVSVSTAHRVEDYAALKISGINVMRGCQPFIVSATGLSELKIPKADLPIFEFAALKHLDGERADFLTASLAGVNTKTIARFDVKFPDYERLWPTAQPTARVVLNGTKLAELLKIMAELSANAGVELRFYGDKKPVELRAGQEHQKARGLIMPLNE